MATYNGKKTIDTMTDIKNGVLVLPAIQRNFVWKPKAIFKLFDSLINDYPIGTFLFWDVNKDNAGGIVFNSFIDEYIETRDGVERGKQIQLQDGRQYFGVLDGQQRLTSIFLGLCGSFKMHKKGKPWDSTDSFESKLLCVDFFSTPNLTDEADTKYHYSLQSREDTLKYIREADTEHYWVPICDIYNDAVHDTHEYSAMKIFNSIDESFAKETQSELSSERRTQLNDQVESLHLAIKNFITSDSINYYSTRQDIFDVVEIFVRVNSGGKTLSAADLILSIASASTNQDVQRMLQEAKDQIKDATKNSEGGLKADEDLILRAAFMLSNADKLSLKDRDNWSKDRVSSVMDNWDDTIDALKNAVAYIEALGFDVGKLTSKNTVLPVAYYLHKIGVSDGRNYATDRDPIAAQDYEDISQWLLRAMIKGIFGDSIPKTLKSIKACIDSHLNDGKQGFPLKDLMNEGTKKSLRINEDDLDEMLNYKYGDVRVKPLLELLSGWDPYCGEYAEVDHIWANDFFSSKRELRQRLGAETPEDVIEHYRNTYQLLPNLECLTRSDNNYKRAKLYNEWLTESRPRKDVRDAFLDKHAIPMDIELSFENYLSFFEKRKELLRQRILEKLSKID